MRKYLTISALFELVILLGIFAIAARDVSDPDFGWHLRTGQQIVQSHSIPHTDFFSHTKFGAPWIAHEWLSEVIIYLAYSVGGWIALLCTFSACIAATFWIVFRRSEGGPYVAGLTTLWGAVATIPFWGVRPQIFTMLLASVFLYLLDRYGRTGSVRVLWWMPPLMILWVNLHGGFAFGLALVGAAIAAEIIDASLHSDRRPDAFYRTRALGLVLALCVLAVLINPNGYRMYSYPFETVNSSSIQGFIQEWQSPNFHLPRMRPFLTLVIGTFVLLAVSRKKPSTRDLLLVASIAYAALQSSRHIPLFALIAVPIASASVTSLLLSRNWTFQHAHHPATTRKTALHAALAAVLLVAVAIRVINVATKQPAFYKQEFPTAALTYLKNRRPPGPIFNSYEWGGYLIWNLYPEYRVFVDGRSDLYGDAFLADFVRTYRAENNWREVLNKFSVNTVVLPPDAPLAVLLKEEPSWQTVFSDNQAVICVRREPRSTLATPYRWQKSNPFAHTRLLWLYPPAPKVSPQTGSVFGNVSGNSDTLLVTRRRWNVIY